MGFLDDFVVKPFSGMTTAVTNATDTSSGNTIEDLAQDKYNFNYRVFPNDLGMDYLGHYMIININVPTKGFSLGAGAGNAAAAGNFTNKFNLVQSGNRLSKVDTLRFGKGQVGGSGAGDAGIASIPRQTRRIEESIAIFMPTGLNFMTQNMYEDVFLGAAGGKLLGGIVDKITGTGLGSAAVGAVGELGGLTRNPINPGVEVIFTTTMLRTFVFRFLMAPRNEAESINMESIIRTLRFHGAPELNTINGGATWIPPAEFDITFFHEGRENRHIPRINTCVLDRIDVDYHPFGKYATFSNGYPVACFLDLSFREVEVIHKKRIDQNF